MLALPGKAVSEKAPAGWESGKRVAGIRRLHRLPEGWSASVGYLRVMHVVLRGVD